jgi:hypothetical protein
MTEPTSPLPPPVNRPLLTRDLGRLGRSLASTAEGRLPAALRWTLSKSGVDLSQASSGISSAPLALDDETLALLLDALSIEIGAIRGVRAPLEMTPELEVALGRLRTAIS